MHKNDTNYQINKIKVEKIIGVKNKILWPKHFKKFHQPGLVLDRAICRIQYIGFKPNFFFFYTLFWAPGSKCWSKVTNQGKRVSLAAGVQGALWFYWCGSGIKFLEANCYKAHKTGKHPKFDSKCHLILNVFSSSILVKNCTRGHQSLQRCNLTFPVMDKAIWV